MTRVCTQVAIAPQLSEGLLGKGKRIGIPFQPGHGYSEPVFCNLIHQRVV